MLVLKFLKVNFFSVFLIMLLTFNVYAKDEFFKCPEKITKVIKSKGQVIKAGSILGVNYIKFSGLKSPFKTITVKFKDLGSKTKARKIVSNKTLVENSLGFEFFDKSSKESVSIENNYNFIKIDNTFAFTRTEFYWSSAGQTQKKNYEYESSGRCIKIKKDEFQLEQIAKVAKKKDKKIKKIETKSIKPKTLKGKRSFAMSWDGYDDLILGRIKFIENDLVGKLEFSLPGNDGACIGTYALSKTKGTWSIFCEKKDVNASGILKWESSNGSVSGTGKDNKGNKVKFKVASIN
ncbi:hypothetical protein N8729_04825 [Candidatus Pelagibacter sp.]|nr:hypothetical protein [Candidatus Pelagibacter sp.]